ncbi:site-specific integrase [Anaerocolumna aminovalerica]|uniref:tyrosine-type recombinase/integrase n=1 Tax=Anaerocolumna aminovalerica TaxID=1527 RepID=UPI001C0EC652|nr:site-specific integrase [Anaerocolumna aminovalerica]MBU5331676.1 site-specific integrase [Anaerocolumna aminovalerica]
MNKIDTMPDGRLRMRISINGKQVPVYGKTPDEVTNKAILKYETAIKNEIEPCKERFDKSLLKYMQTFKFSTWSKSTLSRNMRLYRTHIENKKIGRFKVGQIEENDIQELLNFIAENYSFSEVRRVKFLINPYFRRMKKTGKISINPMLDIELPQEENCAVQTKDMNEIILSEDEMKKLLLVAQKYENMDNIISVYYHALLILMSTGIRVGELMALEWTDIDFDLNIFLITRSTNYVDVLDKNGETTKYVRIVKEPKTKTGKRVVGMSEQCRISLEYIKNYQKKHKLDNKHNLVICNSNGNYIQNRDLRDVLKRISKETGINEKATIHGLRHTFGTYVYGKTKDLVGIQRTLGHSDSRTTEKFYVHTQIELLKSISNAFDMKTVTDLETQL